MMKVTEANPQTLKYCFSFCDLYIFKLKKFVLFFGVFLITDL